MAIQSVVDMEACSGWHQQDACRKANQWALAEGVCQSCRPVDLIDEGLEQKWLNDRLYGNCSDALDSIPIHANVKVLAMMYNSK